MVSFHKMTMEDIDQVSQLEAKTFSMPWSRDAFAQMVDNPSALFLLAMDGDKLAGTCGIMTVVGEGDISNVAVDEQYRRQGIAYELVKNAMDIASREQLLVLFRTGQKVAEKMSQRISSLHKENCSLRSRCGRKRLLCANEIV